MAVDFVCTFIIGLLFGAMGTILVEECLPSWKSWWKKHFGKNKGRF